MNFVLIETNIPNKFEFPNHKYGDAGLIKIILDVFFSSQTL